ncbi:MAG: glycine cleavage system protein GcvH [Deltaproteobacteria bacterium]|nr:glycine cleavage system protein GcvH [Deltaproteobacteria bacterium]
MSQEIKNDRVYTKDHEWAKDEGDAIAIGITAYAVEQLGDITLVNLDVAEGDTIEAGKPFGTVESVKTLADLFAPIGGTIVRVNKAALEERPELVNEDCYGAAWMVAIAPSDGAALGGLLDAAAYAKLLSDSH